MKPKNPEHYEARSYAGRIEIRQNDDGSSTMHGVAAVFDSLSENLGGFREIIKPGAFDDTDMSDVRGLFNHDRNIILGRTVSDTLQVRQNDDGLVYDVDLPGTQLVRDMVIEPIKRGDVSESSFGFIVGRGNDQWDEDDDGRIIRTIHRVNRVFDVSPVVFAAYSDTKVAVRMLEQRNNALAEDRERVAGEIRQRERTLEIIDRRSQLVSRV